MIQKFIAVLGEKNVKENEPMSLHTTFRTGGCADLFLIVDTISALKNVLKICADEGVKHYLVGNGSNLLISDDGYKGVIIKLGKGFFDITVDSLNNSESVIKAGAGVLLSKVARFALDNSLAGFEFAAGIPGTVGGAIVMNAGAYGGEMKDVVKSVTVMDANGDVKTLSCDEMQFEYRNSIVKKEGLYVLETEFLLSCGNKNEIEDKMNELCAKRREKQPLEYPSAGSTFKRPDGYFAGKLIEDAGLRGYRCGGACVSDKHCGFVVNDNNATTADVLAVINYVQETVYDKFGIKLEPEVKIL